MIGTHPHRACDGGHSVRGFYETQGTKIVPEHHGVAGRTCKASLLRIVHEENEIYLMKGTAR